MEFWRQGLKFECQGSGKCCVSHGGYGYVFMTLEDRRRMANELQLSTQQFTRRHCEKEDGIWRLKDGENGDCLFLKNRRCTAYRGRPTQCRTWPFWPETLKAKTWNHEVASFCPGVGRGRTWTADEIQEQLREQLESEKHYGS